MVHAESDFYLPSIQKKKGKIWKAWLARKVFPVYSPIQAMVSYCTIGYAQTYYQLLQTEEKSRGNTLPWKNSYSSFCYAMTLFYAMTLSRSAQTCRF